MVVKSRLSVLVGSEEYVEAYTSNNGTHLVVQGGENVAVQQRWIDEASRPRRPNSKSDVRSTWLCGRSERRAFWEPVFADGFNVYSGENGSQLVGGIDTARYHYVHGEKFEMPPGGVGLDLDPSRCDIEILETKDKTVITQWCALRKGETLTFAKEPGVDKTEAGVFYVDFVDSEDVGLSGLTCTWRNGDDNGNGQIDKCRETMFVYKPAHTRAYASSVTHLGEPLGLHPKVLADLSDFEAHAQCEYFMYAALPRDLFVDKFQSSPVFVFGEHDLEQPEYKLTETWGSEVMFRLEPGRVTEITLHSRYIEPHVGGGFKIVTFRPLVFEACDTGNDNVVRNPFYSKGLGYEAYFTNDTVFHHIDSPQLHVPIPRANSDDYGSIQWITLLCIVFSLGYLLSKLFGGAPKRPSPKSTLH